MKHLLMILLGAIMSVCLLAAALLTVAEPQVIVKEVEVPVEVITERQVLVNPCEQLGLTTTHVKEVKYYTGEVRIGIVCKKVDK